MEKYASMAVYQVLAGCIIKKLPHQVSTFIIIDEVPMNAMHFRQRAPSRIGSRFDPTGLGSQV